MSPTAREQLFAITAKPVANSQGSLAFLTKHRQIRVSARVTAISPVSALNRVFPAVCSHNHNTGWVKLAHNTPISWLFSGNRSRSAANTASTHIPSTSKVSKYAVGQEKE